MPRRQAVTARGRDRDEELPVARDTLEAVGAAIGEAEAGACDEVADDGGDEHVSRSRRRGHPRADVHRDPAHASSLVLDFAGVQPGVDVKAEAARGVTHGAGAAHGALRRIEDREEAITGSIDLLTAEPRQLPPDEGLIALLGVMPAPVAQFDGELGRAADVDKGTVVRVRAEQPELDGGTAWVRSATPSLARMCSTWVFTVAMLTVRLCATSALV
jgi:hypothetical protein